MTYEHNITNTIKETVRVDHDHILKNKKIISTTKLKSVSVHWQRHIFRNGHLTDSVCVKCHPVALWTLLLHFLVSVIQGTGSE